CVSENIIKRLCLAYSFGCAANNYGELCFVIHLGADLRQDNRRVVGTQRIREFVEDERSLGRRGAAFDRVIHIVTANSQNFAGIHSRQKLDSVERKSKAFTAAPGFVFQELLNLGQSAGASFDHVEATRPLKQPACWLPAGILEGPGTSDDINDLFIAQNTQG